MLRPFPESPLKPVASFLAGQIAHGSLPVVWGPMEIPEHTHKGPWKAWSVAVGSAGIVLMVLHGLVVLSLGVDVPHADEWVLLQPEASAANLRGAWLWEPHNEHRLVFTKLLAWVLYRCGNLHLPTQTAVNFLLYVCLATAQAAATVADNDAARQSRPRFSLSSSF